MGPHATLDWPDDDELKWAHVYPGAGRVYFRGWANATPPTDTTPPISTFNEAIAQLSGSERYLLKNLNVTKEAIAGIGESIRAGTARVVSDGSYYADTGIATFEVGIESADKQHKMDARQYVPGTLSENDPYRAESMGILAGLCVVKCICDYKEIGEGNVKVGCDGQAALDMAFKKDWDFKTTDRHHDVMTMIHSQRCQIKVGLQPHWIKGHQDDRITFRLLDRMTQMNILCDEGAKALGAGEDHEQLPKELHAKIWEIHLGENRIINRIEDKMREWIHDPKLRQYWVDKEVLSEEAIPVVDWEATARAAKLTRKKVTITMTKLLSNNAATNTNMMKWGYRTADGCP